MLHGMEEKFRAQYGPKTGVSLDPSPGYQGEQIPSPSIRYLDTALETARWVKIQADATRETMLQRMNELGVLPCPLPEQANAPAKGDGLLFEMERMLRETHDILVEIQSYITRM